MSPEEAEFVAELHNFDSEAQHAAFFLYATFSIDHAAAQSRRLLNRLNRTPTFWVTIRVALRTSAYITISRVFDQGSPHNVDRLIRLAQNNPQVFSRDALAARKRGDGNREPKWLAEYLEDAYYPTATTFRKLRRRVADNRRVFERLVRPARNRFLAHREVINQQEVSRLYQGGTVGELWKLSVFLVQLHEVLWELLHNGRRPRFRPRRYSVPAMFRVRPRGHAAHERMVREAIDAMQIVEGTEAQQGAPVGRASLREARR
jgi:hypothetical protein